MLEAVTDITPAPWWASTINSLALLVAGALISTFTAWITDRRKTRHADEQRWDEELLKRAGLLIESMDAAYTANYALQEEINRQLQANDGSGITSPEVREKLVVAKDTVKQFTRDQIHLQLIAPQNVATAVLEFGRLFGDVQAEVEIKPLPPARPDIAVLTQFTIALRESAGIPWRVRRRASQE
ncbi:hypothetical protein [Rathayibacter sp. Leaf248]|uniref:hypothetical protein n=1 Tax=Rathayibacter sp. Leaf248 TaxID=2876555 RepID=UPI001E4E3E67|nr:hypothetical protein [Rathayibacter sp. Leaf248]